MKTKAKHTSKNAIAALVASLLIGYHAHYYVAEAVVRAYITRATVALNNGEEPAAPTLLEKLAVFGISGLFK